MIERQEVASLPGTESILGLKALCPRQTRMISNRSPY